jgi:hypothetical protein
VAAATETNVLDSEVVASMLARVRRDDSLERLTLRLREVLALDSGAARTRRSRNSSA